jgi:hypothetical protein
VAAQGYCCGLSPSPAAFAGALPQLQKAFSDSGVVDRWEMPSLWNAVHVDGEVSGEN